MRHLTLRDIPRFTASVLADAALHDLVAADAVLNEAEGWTIARRDEACVSPERMPAPYRLERDRRAGVFRNNVEVWEHIHAQASHGSARHKRVILFLLARSPGEIAMIERHAFPASANIPGFRFAAL